MYTCMHVCITAEMLDTIPDYLLHQQLKLVDRPEKCNKKASAAECAQQQVVHVSFLICMPHGKACPLTTC